MAIDRKELAEKLVELMRDGSNGSPSNWVEASRSPRVRLDGAWNIQRIADGLAKHIEGGARG